MVCHHIKVVSEHHDTKIALVWIARMSLITVLEEIPVKSLSFWFGQDAQSSADQNFTSDITGVNVYS